MSDKAKGWIYVLIQFALIVIIVIAARIENYLMNYLYNPWIIGLGGALFIAGLFLAILSVISFRQIITPHPIPLEGSKLRTSGMYKIVRHPIFFSVLVIMAGIVFVLQAYFTQVLVIALFFWFRFKAMFEEKYLLRKFPDYTEYSVKTKMLIPLLY